MMGCKIYTVIRIIYDSIQGKPVHFIDQIFIQINNPHKQELFLQQLFTIVYDAYRFIQRSSL